MKNSIIKLKNNKSGFVGIIIAIVILVAIVAGVVVTVVLRGGPFNLIGEINYEYTSTDNLNLTLNIDNTVGSVSIENDDSMTNLMEARLEVWGRSEANLSDAVNFTSTIADDRVVISFDSGDKIWKWIDKDAFYQALFIKINPNAIAEYNILITTGSVNLDFDSLTESEILKLDVLITTGSIDVNFGDNTYLNTSDVNLETTTGSIDIISQNVKFTDDINWIITTTTGSIELTIGQEAIPLKDYVATYDATAITGSINLYYTLNENDFGVRITAQTTTGSINIPGDGNLYESSDYSLKTIKYIFNLDTTTGSINAS